MFKFIKKLLWYSKDEPKWQEYHYGRYQHKPIYIRCLPMITGLDEGTIRDIVSNKIIRINNVILSSYSLDGRLESGSYTIEIPHLHKKWTFHIA